MKVNQQTVKTAWLVVALLLPVALLNYLDRQMLASMKFSVMGDIKDIGTDTNWGIMLAQFKWVYAIFSPIGGYLADRFSRKWIICLSLFVWSAITWWTGHADSYNTLLWTRTAMGISEALYIPAALALIVDFHTGATKSRAVGMHMAAIYLGVIMGGFAGFAADSPAIGWRMTFNITGALGVLYAFPLFFLLKDAPKPETEAAAGKKPSPWQAAAALLGSPSFLLLALYFTLVAMPGWMMKDWMPSMLKDQFNISQGMAGVSASLYVNIAGFGGLFLGSLLSDRWIKKNLRGRTYISAIGMGLLIPALYGLGHSPSLSVAIIFLLLFGLGFGFFDCNNMPILCQIVRPELRATGYGVMNLVSISCGGFADWGFGELRDRDVPLNVIFGVFAGVALLSVIIVLLIRPARDTAAPSAT